MKRWKILNTSQKLVLSQVEGSKVPTSRLLRRPVLRRRLRQSESGCEGRARLRRASKSQKLEHEDIIKILLENRGLKTKREVEEFLNPKLEHVAIERVEIDKKQLRKAISRIRKAIKNKEKIVIFGDYDVDGICGTAILWETLHSLGARVMPYIPHRVEEGYGLSIRGIDNVKCQISNVKLVITVDNGIVANKAVEFANKEVIDVIITDHHVASKDLPKAYAIVHTTKLCGAGVAWMLAREIENRRLKIENGNGKWKMKNGKFLELVALATIADLVPLTGANRTLVKFGIEKVRQTNRIGLLELFKEAGLDQGEIGVYEIGHIIAPRLNAMGRLEYAMDSLRLLCTRNQNRARILAHKLGSTNKERQDLTIQTVEHAKENLKSQISNLKSASGNLKSLLFISHESYQQGVIGLVAGKLVEEFYRPAIVVSIGEKYSKGSARSINGFNIIEFIRNASELLVDAGGHPMAAGFTIETEKLTMLQKTLEEKAQESLDEELLIRTLRIDCELPLWVIDLDLYQEIQNLAPFGRGNPEPTFVSRGVTIEDMRMVGNDRRHLKLRISEANLGQVPSHRHSGDSERSVEDSRISNGNERFWTSLASADPLRPSFSEARASAKESQNDVVFDGIAFGMGERANELHIGDKVDIVYTIDEDDWNGNKKLQLKIKDIKKALEN